MAWEYHSINDTLEAEELPIEWVWERLRIKRDRELAVCDYRVISDAPWDVQPWLAYRQALRDLPKTNKDPRQITFPEQPA